MSMHKDVLQAECAEIKNGNNGDLLVAGPEQFQKLDEIIIVIRHGPTEKPPNNDGDNFCEQVADSGILFC